MSGPKKISHISSEKAKRNVFYRYVASDSWPSFDPAKRTCFTESGKSTVERLRYHQQNPWEKLRIQGGNGWREEGNGGAEEGRGGRAARQK